MNFLPACCPATKGGSANEAEITQPSPLHRNVGWRICEPDCITVRTHGTRRRQTVGRPLGSLGARSQRYLQGTRRGVGGQGEGRRPDRLHHIAGREAAADDRRRGAGPVGPRHHADAELVAARPCQQPRASRRHRDGAHQAERRRRRHVDIPRPRRQPLDRGAGDHGQPDQRALLTHRPDEAARRHRRAGHVPGRAARPRPRTGRSTHSSRPRKPATRPGTRSASASARRRTWSIPRARSSDRSGRHSSTPTRRSRSRRDAVRQALDFYKRLRSVLPARCAVLGRRFQQQVAGGGQRRVDHEPAERLGGGQARCAQGGRAIVDARHAGRAQGTLRAVHSQLLGDLELRQEQVGRQEPPRAPVAAIGDREDWWWPAAATTCPPSRT